MFVGTDGIPTRAILDSKVDNYGSMVYGKYFFSFQLSRSKNMSIYVCLQSQGTLGPINEWNFNHQV